MLDNAEITRAGFGARAGAFIIDRALLLIALCAVRVPAMIAAMFGSTAFTAKSFLFDHSALDVVCWLLSAAYFVLLTYFTGSTLGKKVMHLRVERADGEALRFIDVLYRETVGRFLSGILYLGYLMVLVDKQKRAFHDWLCDTCVVYEDVRFRVREKNAPEAKNYGYSLPDASADAPAEAPRMTDYGYSLQTQPEDGRTETDTEKE